MHRFWPPEDQNQNLQPMKNYIKLAVFALSICAFSTTMHAQSNAKQVTPPSDALSGFTYDFNKVMTLITERIATPSTNNAEAQVFLDHKDFPKIPANKINHSESRDQIRIWMEKNPDLIINTLKHRKDIVTQY